MKRYECSKLHTNDTNSDYSGVNSDNSCRSRGFSLVEILLAVSIFGLTVMVLAGGLIYGQESTAISGARSRAVILAEEGLEAVRNIRDESFSNLTLTEESHGLSSSGTIWSFSGTEDTTEGVFTRKIVITPVDTNRKQVTSTVSWQQNPQRTGSVTLTTYLTAWINPVGGGEPPVSCSAYCQSLPAGYTDGTCRQNDQQCTTNGEIYEEGGNDICITNFPGDPSHDTCCCL